MEIRSFLGRPVTLPEGLSALGVKVCASDDVAVFDGGGVSFPNKFVVTGGRVDCVLGRGGCGGDDRDCFTTARGTESSVEESLSRLSRMEGSCGGVGDRTHLLEEYFVRMKFSILESLGIWDGGKDASQYLPLVSLADTQTQTQTPETPKFIRARYTRKRSGRCTC